MKYWLFDGKDAQGPYEADELKRLPGFTADSMICPDGAASADQWKPAQFYLIRPPSAKAADAAAQAKTGRMGRIADAQLEDARVEAAATAATAAAERALAPRSRLSPAALASIAAMLAALAAGSLYLRRPKAKAPAHEAPVAAAAKAPEAAPPAPVIDEAMQREAVDFTKSFPLQSEAAAQPLAAADVLEPARWRAPRTLGEILERRGLQALGLSAASDAQKRGKTAAQARRELAADRALWSDRGGRWLARNVSLRWEAEPIVGSRWRVTASRAERRGAPEEAMAWEADLLKRTLKPLDLEAWLAVDAKGAGRWADRNAPLGELAPPGAAAQAAPAYEIARPRAVRGPRPVAARSKGAPPAPTGPADDIGDEDLGDLDEPGEAPLAQSQPEPAAPPLKSRSFEEPPAQDVKPDPETLAKNEPAPKPKAPPAAKSDAKPAPQDAPKGKADGHKNAMDMSVDELRSYLNRDGGDKQFQ